MSIQNAIDFEKRKNYELLNGRIVNYSNIDLKFFKKWEKFWKDDIGITQGDRIGLLIGENELIMPVVLSLDNIICEIEFFNSGINRKNIEQNIIKYNCIISDQKLNYQEDRQIKEIELFKKKLFVYDFEKNTPLGGKRKSYIYYTSGSTGQPKAFYKTENAVIKEGTAILNEINMCASDNILCIAPCVHVFAQSIACVAAMLAGAKVEYMQTIVSPNQIIKKIKKNNYDILITTPLYFEYLCGFKKEMEGISKLITGGAKLSQKVIDSGLDIISFYGTTETGVISINKGQKQDNSVGRVVKGVEIVGEKTVSISKGKELKRIAVKSEFNSYAYREGPEKLVQLQGTIVLNDYGYKKDEELFVMGRIDNIINVNGLKVSSAEIEKELMKNEYIEKVSVIKQIKDSREYAKAYVVLKSDSHIEEEQLFEFCKKNIEHYKIPNKIEIVEELHYTETGKILVN